MNETWTWIYNLPRGSGLICMSSTESSRPRGLIGSRSSLEPAPLPEIKFLFFGDILAWAPGLAGLPAGMILLLSMLFLRLISVVKAAAR
jgi:hypothetical protein